MRALLAADEALLAWAPWDDRTYLWVVRKDGAEMHSLEIGADALADAVSELRAGLDPFSVETLKFKKFPRFDTTRAYELYSKMFAPTEPLLEGAAHVFVVPDGALQSLPLCVLVTGKPKGPSPIFPATGRCRGSPAGTRSPCCRRSRRSGR